MYRARSPELALAGHIVRCFLEKGSAIERWSWRYYPQLQLDEAQAVVV